MCDSDNQVLKARLCIAGLEDSFRALSGMNIKTMDCSLAVVIEVYCWDRVTTSFTWLSFNMQRC